MSNLEKLQESRFAKSIFEQHVRIKGEFDCWDQIKDLDAFVNGLRFTSAANLIVYMADETYKPKSMKIRHLCRNKKCCNLNHMEIVYKNHIK